MQDWLFDHILEDEKRKLKLTISTGQIQGGKLTDEQKEKLKTALCDVVDVAYMWVPEA